MSLILDALRKAQRERQIGQPPGRLPLLEDRGGSRRRRRSLVAAGAMAIAFAALGLLALARWGGAPKSAVSPLQPGSAEATRPQEPPLRQPSDVVRQVGSPATADDASSPQSRMGEQTRAELESARPPAEPPPPPQPEAQAGEVDLPGPARPEPEPSEPLPSPKTQPTPLTRPGASMSAGRSAPQRPAPEPRPAPTWRPEPSPARPPAPGPRVPPQTPADRKTIAPSPAVALPNATKGPEKSAVPARPAAIESKGAPEAAGAGPSLPEAPMTRTEARTDQEAPARKPEPGEASPAGPQAPAAPAPPKAKPETGKAVPLVSELPPEARGDLDKLEINGHVYTEDPGQRLVFINLRTYRAGDRIGTNGPVVKEITPDGAILDYGAGRALLPLRKQGIGAKK